MIEVWWWNNLGVSDERSSQNMVMEQLKYVERNKQLKCADGTTQVCRTTRILQQ